MRCARDSPRYSKTNYKVAMAVSVELKFFGARGLHNERVALNSVKKKNRNIYFMQFLRPNWLISRSISFWNYIVENNLNCCTTYCRLNQRI